MYNTNQRKLFPLGYKLRLLFDVKESIGIHGKDKAKKLCDRQADSIKIHRSVRIPGVKGRIMRIKEQGAHWQTVSCRSNRREHLSSSFTA
jgi:hypothetical protein